MRSSKALGEELYLRQSFTKSVRIVFMLSETSIIVGKKASALTNDSGPLVKSREHLCKTSRNALR